MGKTLLFAIKDLIILAVFVIACLAIFGGARLPQQFPILAFGQYQIGLFPLGFAIYQHNTNGPYYSFSPFNDFYISQAGFRSPLLESKEYQDKQFSTNADQPAWQHLPLVWQNIVNQAQPDYLLENSRQKTTYHAQIVENELVMKRTTHLKNNENITAGGLTIQFYDQDFVFDPNTRQLYSQVEPKDANYYNAHYSTRLTFQPIPEDLANPYEFTWIVESGKLVLVNPSKPGALLITAQPGQTILIHPLSKLIEIVEQNSQKSSKLEQTVRVKSFSDLKEII